MRLLLAVIFFLAAISQVMAYKCIGPINTPNQAKDQALIATCENITDQDYVYEDSKMIAWFDFSSGGFLRGIWLKKNGKLLQSENSLGKTISTNLLFGGGYEILAGPISSPDSPTGNFMIFEEHNPSPGLGGRKYVIERDGYTEIGFIGRLYNFGIKDVPGFDPNKDPIKPEHREPNVYINTSWPKDKSYWVHVETDSTTLAMKFVKRQGDGTARRLSCRIRFKIYHDSARYDANWDVFLYNKPELCALLLMFDFLHEQNPNGNAYVKQLGETGLNTCRWDAAVFDEWLGIPPEKFNRITAPHGVISTIKHTQQPNYSGNGATSFVVFKPNLRSPWIEISNGNRNALGKVISGLDVTVRRDLKNINDCSHFGFTDTPWYDGSTLGNWWITSEVALKTDKPKKDFEVRSFSETVTLKTGD